MLLIVSVRDCYLYHLPIIALCSFVCSWMVWRLVKLFPRSAFRDTGLSLVYVCIGKVMVDWGYVSGLPKPYGSLTGFH